MSAMRAAPGQVAQLRDKARVEAGLETQRARSSSDTLRYPFGVRYARELGWLLVRDCFSGEWLEVWAKDCPPSWRSMAFEEKRRRQLEREQREEAPAF